MRAAGEGTESTLSLASVLRGQGRFLCLEEDEGRIESCRRGCGALNQWIEYVPGDPAASLRRLREEGELERIHLAFLHSRGDAEGPWNGYRALDDLLAPGSILIVDDAVRGDAPGRRVTSHLSDRPGWDARIVLVGPGILVAQRRS